MKKLKVIIKRAGHDPIEAEIDEGIESLRTAVDCEILELVRGDAVGLPGVDIWTDDEGKCRDDWQPNFKLVTVDDIPFDVVGGDAVFAGFTPSGNTVSLPAGMRQKVLDYLAKNTVVSVGG